jgi:hypothetical protein
MHETLTWPPVPGRPHLRRTAARWLYRASRGLDRWAERLAAVPAVAEAATRHEPVREFHPGPGRGDGTLFVDGRRRLSLPGITRL